MSEVNVPSWLNESYFEEILVKHLKNSAIKVRDIKVEPCSAAGFISILLRVNVNYCANSEEVSTSFVLKMRTTQELAIEKIGVNGYDVQNNEMNFFEVVAPQMEKVLKKIGEDKNVIPKVFAIDRIHDVIVFEDLTTMKFVMADRLKGLNEAHIELALRKLAKFHAASLVIHRKHHKTLESFDTCFFTRNVNVFNDSFMSIYELAVEEIETWDGYENYAKKLKQLEQSVIENANLCFDVGIDEFCVFNHGDLWNSNLMFSYDDSGDVVDAILIDFQFCHWGSPALDLIHLLYTSLNDELYTQETIELFVQKFYYEVKEMLKKLDYNLINFPTLHQYQLQFLGKLFYGLMYTLIVFPIMTSEDADNDFIAHQSRDERATSFKKRILKEEKYQKTVKKMLPVFDRLGLLDSNISSLI